MRRQSSLRLLKSHPSKLLLPMANMNTRFRSSRFLRAVPLLSR
jgi:hypothetical protein